MGWFFRFKLHLICNECGELLNFIITLGDMDDRKPLESNSFVEFIYGKLVGDKGYIGKNLFQRLYNQVEKQYGGGIDVCFGQTASQETGHYRNH